MDRTGLPGTFDFRAEYAWPESAGLPRLAEPSGPSIFTAFEEQLGLKLEPARVPVEVLVIDRAGHPAEN